MLKLDYYHDFYHAKLDPKMQMLTKNIPQVHDIIHIIYTYDST